MAQTNDTPLTRDALIDIIMRETTDEVTADGLPIGRPNILEVGCRYVRGVPSRGYVDPAEAARNFAGFIADAVLEAAASQPHGKSGGLALEALRAANVERQAAWCPDPNQQPDLGYRGNELAGETGEACNVIKKLERERHGWAGSRDTLEHLAEELADVVICADLCAITAGVDLASAVVAKFNATSAKVGLSQRLAMQSAPVRE